MSSNSSATNRRSTSYFVKFPTIPSLNNVMGQPMGIVIKQKALSHDLAILEYPTQNESLLKTLTTGVPVSFEWKKGSDSAKFVGYVSYVSSEISVSPKKRMEVHCVGASYPLKERKTRTFKNKTITQIAQIIAKEKGLKFVGEFHPRVFPQLTIANQSYWEWLHEQAKRIGYAMYVENTTMHFRPFDKLIDEGSSTAPVMAAFASDVPTDTLYYDRTLDYFKALKGDYIEGTELRNIKTVGGVNPVTGKLITAKKTPVKAGKRVRASSNSVLFEEQRTDQVVHDAIAANSSALGAAQMARFNMPARIKGQGHPLMRPYHPVYVDGIDARFNGFWVPDEITHYLTMVGEYQVEMHALADGTGVNAPAVGRKTSTSLVGKVDLEAAVANGGRATHLRTAPNSSLRSASLHVKETGQGYTKTPTVWVHKPVRKK